MGFLQPYFFFISESLVKLIFLARIGITHYQRQGCRAKRPGSLLQKIDGPSPREKCMNHQADGFFLPKNVQSTHLEDARLSGVNADRLHQGKADFIYPGAQVKKTFNHAGLVTAVTDGESLTLLMCSYSASSICELATSSSSGEVQLGSRPALAELTFLEETPIVKIVCLPKSAASNGPPRGQATSFFGSIQCSKHRVLIHSQLSENGNHRVSGLPASGSKRI